MSDLSLFLAQERPLKVFLGGFAILPMLLGEQFGHDERPNGNQTMES
jgi:hypothetical protein